MGEDSIALATQGYGWLPNRRRRRGDTFRTRLGGLPVVALCGPDAGPFFYDERTVRRHGAIPEPLRSTLFGHGAVHTLDGTAHRVRKAMFLSVLRPDAVDALVDRVTDAWDAAAARWPRQRTVVLFDEAARVITRGVGGWAGVPVTDGLASDLVLLVDGFATAAPRHWRARLARRRLEARLSDLVEAVRAGTATAPDGSALHAVSHHRDADGSALPARVAAVELLNVIRPTVAVAWFVSFTAHALHRWPEHRTRLASGDPAFVTAFVHEVRRFYPFAPFIGGKAVRDTSFDGVPVRAGDTVLLDLNGHDHDPRVFPDPYAFRPERFTGRLPRPFELIAQGAGDPAAGHRCPGEGVTVALLRVLATRLARLSYRVPRQDLAIPLGRIPTLPRSRMVLSHVRAPDRAGATRGTDSTVR